MTCLSTAPRTLPPLWSRPLQHPRRPMALALHHQEGHARTRVVRGERGAGAGNGWGGEGVVPIRPENRDRYPSDWKQISHRIRFVRADSRCECEGECGRGTHKGRCPNYHGLKAYGTGSAVVLTVAHLNHTPEDCRDENLRAMCQGCHLHYDREHHAQTAQRTKTAALEGQMESMFDA